MEKMKCKFKNNKYSSYKTKTRFYYKILIFIKTKIKDN